MNRTTSEKLRITGRRSGVKRQRLFNVAAMLFTLLFALGSSAIETPGAQTSHNLDYQACFFRAKSRVSDAEQAQVVAENALRLALEILARTIGLKEQTEVDIKGRPPRSLVPAPGIDSLWLEALENNPEIRELNLQIKQSEALVGAAKGGYYPTLMY
ncbi:MAG: TolC family protein [Deltaproteobacteria bacterium]|jgi:hypothetical protein|nr:TolC family protein [Deltaproteobacteria bacterium]